jgi:hypothetical protein
VWQAGLATDGSLAGIDVFRTRPLQPPAVKVLAPQSLDQSEALRTWVAAEAIAKATGRPSAAVGRDLASGRLSSLRRMATVEEPEPGVLVAFISEPGARTVVVLHRAPSTWLARTS